MNKHNILTSELKKYIIISLGPSAQCLLCLYYITHKYVKTQKQADEGLLFCISDSIRFRAHLIVCVCCIMDVPPAVGSDPTSQPSTPAFFKFPHTPFFSAKEGSHMSPLWLQRSIRPFPPHFTLSPVLTIYPCSCSCVLTFLFL